MKIDDQQLLSICLAEIDSSTGSTSGELSSQRADGMDRYLAEPYGDEIEGRSQVLTREVYETIESILPSLVRIFTNSDNMVVFDPTGAEDEEMAEQQSDVVNHIYWKQNRGFYNTYTVLKDCLISKTGIMKVWAEIDDEEKREEYEGLDEMELGQLMSDESVEREVIESEVTESGYNVTFKTKEKKVKIHCAPVPPEEFGVNGDASSPYAKDAQFIFQRSRKSYTELVADGYDREFLESLPTNDDIATQERSARRHLTDESDLLSAASEISMRMFWVTECYLHIDRDDDGIAELLKVTLAAGAYSGSSGRLLDVEEVDSIPFSTAPPNILTHKFYGLSVADLVLDLQQINTTLLRQVLDNTYLANNGRTALNTDYVNEDDLLTRRPGGLVRYDGPLPWSSVVGEIPFNQLPPQTFEVFERLDERQKRRTGTGDEVGMLDANSLANVNTGVAALAFDAARAKVELIARIIAELLFKPVFHDIHELLCKHQNKEMVMKLRGQWVPVNPSEWKTRENSTVKVGIGQISRERRIMGLEAVIAKQQALVAGGAMGTLVMPEMMYESHKGWTKAWGFEPDLFFQDPQQLPPPKPQEPGAQEQLMMAQAKALMMEGESNQQKNQIAADKIQLDAQMQQQAMERKGAEILLTAQIEKLKSDLNVAKVDADVTGKVRSMQAQRDKDDIQTSLQAKEMQLDQLNADKDRELKAYEMQSKHYVELLKLQNINYDPVEREREVMESEHKEQAAHDEKEVDRQLMGELHANLVSMTEKLGEMELAANAPKDVLRDKAGLILTIGGKVITRDKSGRATRIG